MARRYGTGTNRRSVPERDRATGRALFLAAGLFALSLAFRVVDLPICPAFPTGTHFVWHLLNALVLYVLLRAAIAHAGKAPAS
jgi:hypothetical protein